MEKSLTSLSELISRPRSPKTKRLLNLIADFSLGYAHNWHFCVPIFFYEALDIQFTERVINKQKTKLWTQESAFNFSKGDVFYNQPYPYCPQFSERRSLFSETLRIKIIAAQAALPQLTIPNKNMGIISLTPSLKKFFTFLHFSLDNYMTLSYIIINKTTGGQKNERPYQPHH